MTNDDDIPVMDILGMRKVADTSDWEAPLNVRVKLPNGEVKPIDVMAMGEDTEGRRVWVNAQPLDLTDTEGLRILYDNRPPNTVVGLMLSKFELQAVGQLLDSLLTTGQAWNAFTDQSQQQANASMIAVGKQSTDDPVEFRDLLAHLADMTESITGYLRDFVHAMDHAGREK